MPTKKKKNGMISNEGFYLSKVLKAAFSYHVFHDFVADAIRYQKNILSSPPDHCNPYRVAVVAHDKTKPKHQKTSRFRNHDTISFNHHPTLFTGAFRAKQSFI
jgi:hypothetical protein